MTEPRGRGSLSAVRDPAMAVAMAKCWLASWTSRAKAANVRTGLPPVDSFHGYECGFCDVPRDIIIRQLEEFTTWSGISSYDEDIPLRAEIESWEMVHSDEQKRRVLKASGLSIEKSPW